MSVKTLRITPLLEVQIARVLKAAEQYPNADDGYGRLEQEQLLLGQEVMREVASQQHRLDRLPRKAEPLGPVVEVTIRPRRKHSA